MGVCEALCHTACKQVYTNAFETIRSQPFQKIISASYYQIRKKALRCVTDLVVPDFHVERTDDLPPLTQDRACGLDELPGQVQPVVDQGRTGPAERGPPQHLHVL